MCAWDRVNYRWAFIYFHFQFQSVCSWWTQQLPLVQILWWVVRFHIIISSQMTLVTLVFILCDIPFKNKVVWTPYLCTYAYLTLDISYWNRNMVFFCYQLNLPCHLTVLYICVIVYIVLLFVFEEIISSNVHLQPLASLCLKNNKLLVADLGGE